MADAKLQLLMDLDDRVSAQMDKIKGSLSSFQDGVEKMKPTFEKMAAIGTAGFAAVSAAAGISLKAYADSEAQLARTDQAIKNVVSTVGGNFDQMSKGARDFGESLKALAGISDEAGAEGFAKMLAVTGGDMAESQKLAGLAADLSVAKQIDYATAVKAVAMVQAGSTKVLKEYGIVLGDNATKEEANAALMKTVGGQAAAYGKTIAGQTDIIKESFDDLQKSIGKDLVPIFENVIRTIKPVIEAMTSWAAKNPQLVSTIILVAGGLFALIAALGTIGVVLGPIIAGVGFLVSAIGFLISPIGLVILAIGLLIAAGVLLYQHWDQIKEFAINTWNGISKAVSGAMTVLAGILSTIWEGIKNALLIGVEFIIGLWVTLLNFLFPGWQGALMNIWNTLVSVWGSITGFLKPGIDALIKFWSDGMDIFSKKWHDIWQGIQDWFGSVWDAIKSIAQGAWDFIQKGIDMIMGPLNNMIQTVTKAFDAAKSALSSAGSAVSGAVSKVVSTGASVLGRATGGPVLGGSTYIVGENGPEFFTPAFSGSIGGGMALAGAGPTFNVYVTGNTLLDRDSARKIGGELVKYLKDNMRL